MIVRTLAEIEGGPRDVRGAAFASRRFLLAEDGMGFTLTETTVEAGTEQTMWYKHHLEGNYIVEGEGELENLETGERFPLRPGTMYALDKHDRHSVRAATRMKIVCVFTPALTGREIHDEDGAYALPPDEAE